MKKMTPVTTILKSSEAPKEKQYTKMELFRIAHNGTAEQIKKAFNF